MRSGWDMYCQQEKKVKSMCFFICITTTAIAADPVVIVTEHGVFDPRGLSLTERAVAISHLAARIPMYQPVILREKKSKR